MILVECSSRNFYDHFLLLTHIYRYTTMQSMQCNLSIGLQFIKYYGHQTDHNSPKCQSVRKSLKTELGLENRELRFYCTHFLRTFEAYPCKYALFDLNVFSDSSPAKNDFFGAQVKSVTCWTFEDSPDPAATRCD